MPEKITNISLVRGAFLLDPLTCERLCDDQYCLRRGSLLVLAVATLVSIARFAGNLLEVFVSRDPKALISLLEDAAGRSYVIQTVLATTDKPLLVSRLWDIGMGLWPFIRFVYMHPLIANTLETALLFAGYFVNWLALGLVGYVVAKLVKGRASLGQTLGCVALATVPSLLQMVEIVPNAELVGVEWFSFAAFFVAIGVSHKLSVRRAAVVTLLTMLINWYVLPFLTIITVWFCLGFL